MPPTSSSWLDATSLQAAHIIAAVGIVACLSAAVGAMVTVRIMKGRGGTGSSSNSGCNDRDSCSSRATSLCCENKKVVTVADEINHIDNGSKMAAIHNAAAAAANGPMANGSCPSAIDSHVSTATTVTTAYTSSPTTICSHSCIPEYSSQSDKAQHNHSSSSDLPRQRQSNNTNRNSNAAVHFLASQNNSELADDLREGEEDDGDDRINYPCCCECSCSACSSCITKVASTAGGGGADEGGEFCPEEVLLLPPNHHHPHRRRRRYAQTRPSSLTSESAFGGEDGSLHDNPDSNDNDHNNREVEESTPLSATAGGGNTTTGDGGDDAHLNYFPRTTTQSSKKSSRHAKKVKMYISETELLFKGQEEFDELILSAAEDSDSQLVLRRTRAVSALANRLMTAPDEASCLEEVTRLMILMFDLEKVTFGMVTGSEHFYLKRIIAKPRNKDCRRSSASSATSATSSSSSDFDLYCLDSDDKRPLEGTAAGVCVKTLKEHYTPNTSESPFATHRVFYQKGYNTVLVTPILVNGNKCAGCILLSKKVKDAFKKSERVIISDIGLLLGANIYAKRLLKEADESKKRSREMLHSFIPAKVLQKIECYWDSNSEEYKKARKHARNDSSYSSTSTPPSDSEELRTNSWYVAQTEWPTQDPKNGTKVGSKKGGRGIEEKRIEFLRNLNRGNSDGEDDAVGVIVKRSETDLIPSTRALYAEDVKDVCIIFTDIVGFSAMSMHLSPIKIMDMLQNLYSRFDELCDVHGVLKLETIGDAYICATNLMENQDSISVRNAAIRALAMAKDMVLEAVNTQIPKFSEESNENENVEEEKDANAVPPWVKFETLEIRVGIHVGEVMCGVLGQRLPKFTTCGKAVNMAARMEQTSQSNRIRVTKDFHDLVGDAETGWSNKEVIPLKNMGDMETYLLDPLELRIREQSPLPMREGGGGVGRRMSSNQYNSNMQAQYPIRTRRRASATTVNSRNSTLRS